MGHNLKKTDSSSSRSHLGFSSSNRGGVFEWLAVVQTTTGAVSSWVQYSCHVQKTLLFHASLPWPRYTPSFMSVPTLGRGMVLIPHLWLSTPLALTLCTWTHTWVVWVPVLTTIHKEISLLRSESWINLWVEAYKFREQFNITSS